jgi:hypothetical protein
MAKMIIICLLVVGVLGFAAAATQAEAPVGVPPLQCNPSGSISSTDKLVPNATTNCGSYTCADNGNCCGDNTCCPSGYNIYCKSKKMCYNTTSGAYAACGNDYYICPQPVK